MLYGYGILNNHVPTLRAAMKGGSANPLNTSLYAAYNAESNTNDSLGVYNASPIGGLTYTTGKIGNAFTFNGSSSVVALPINSMKFTGDYSYSFFIYFDFIGSQVKYIFNNETYNAATGGDNGYYITASNTGFAFKGIKNGAFVFQCQSTTTPTNGVWYHCVVTKTSSQVKMYINGNLETTTNYTGTVGYNTTMNPAIGAAYLSYLTNSYDYLYSGAKIDLFNIFEKALTLTEVTELYNSGSGKKYPF